MERHNSTIAIKRQLLNPLNIFPNLLRMDSLLHIISPICSTPIYYTCSICEYKVPFELIDSFLPMRSPRVQNSFSLGIIFSFWVFGLFLIHPRPKTLLFWRQITMFGHFLSFLPISAQNPSTFDAKISLFGYFHSFLSVSAQNIAFFKEKQEILGAIVQK